MVRCTVRFLLDLLLVFILYVSAFGQGTQDQTVPRLATIRGQIRLTDGHSGPRGAAVYLEMQTGGNSSQTQSDSQGKFEFQQVVPGIYDVQVRAPGFHIESQRVDLTTFPMSYLTFTLRPEAGGESSVPPEGAAGAISALDAAAPEGARKDFESGRNLLNQGKDLGKSVGFFQRAVTAYPQYPEAYMYLGLAYSSQKNWADAQKALQKSVDLNKDNAAALIALGATENEQKNYQDAEKHLSQAATMAPDSADAHLELGRAYSGLQRWSDADHHVAQANKLRPNNAGQHVLMGNILLRERNAEGALQEYKEAVKDDPKGPWADPANQMINKIEAALAGAKK